MNNFATFILILGFFSPIQNVLSLRSALRVTDDMKDVISGLEKVEAPPVQTTVVRDSDKLEVVDRLPYAVSENLYESGIPEQINNDEVGLVTDLIESQSGLSITELEQPLNREMDKDEVVSLAEEKHDINNLLERLRNIEKSTKTLKDALKHEKNGERLHKQYAKANEKDGMKVYYSVHGVNDQHDDDEYEYSGKKSKIVYVPYVLHKPGRKPHVKLHNRYKDLVTLPGQLISQEYNAAKGMKFHPFGILTE